jgi:hypothetical protein
MCEHETCLYHISRSRCSEELLSADWYIWNDVSHLHLQGTVKSTLQKGAACKHLP